MRDSKRSGLEGEWEGEWDSGKREVSLRLR